MGLRSGLGLPPGCRGLLDRWGGLAGGDFGFDPRQHISGVAALFWLAGHGQTLGIEKENSEGGFIELSELVDDRHGRNSWSATAENGPAGITACRRAGIVPEGDTALGEVVWRHFNGDSVAPQRLDPIALHAAGGIGKNLVLVVEENTEARLRQDVHDNPFEFEQLFLWHGNSLSSVYRNSKARRCWQGGLHVTDAYSASKHLKVSGIRLTALGDDVELDLLALIQARKPGALDRADVDEDILRTVIRLNEAETLLGIKPFNFAGWHNFSSS
jgi:hypothetical protein